MNNRFLKKNMFLTLATVIVFAQTSCGKAHNTPDNSAQAATEVLETAEE